MLRLSFTCEKGDAWTATYRDLEAKMIENSLVRIDMSGVPDAERKDRMQGEADKYQASLSIENGVLFRAVYFDCAPAEGRLLLIFHHLVVDGMSWRVLLSELEQMYQALVSEKTIATPKMDASYQQWGRFLQDYLRSANLAKEKNYWLEQLTGKLKPIPTEHTGDVDQSRANSRQKTFALSPALTQDLLKRCNQAYQTQVNDLLLTAVWLAMSAWMGSTRVRLDLEGHGREDLGQGFDLGSTVGWFTSVFPVLLESKRPNSLEDSIMEIKESLRKIPNKGIGFGLFHDLLQDKEIVNAKNALGLPLVFNYLGQLDQTLPQGTAFRVSQELVNSSVSLKRKRAHLLGLLGMVINGQLSISIDYNVQQYTEATIDALLEKLQLALEQVIAQCMAALAVTKFTPSDFPLARVTQKQLSQWQQTYPLLEDLYDSTAMQKGLLYHSHLDRSAYVTQVYMDISGELDQSIFKQAWRDTVKRQPHFPYLVCRRVFATTGCCRCRTRLVCRRLARPRRHKASRPA